MLQSSVKVSVLISFIVLLISSIILIRLFVLFLEPVLGGCDSFHLLKQSTEIFLIFKSHFF